MKDERLGLPSASGAEKLYMCAGSWQAEKDAPDTEPTDEAVQGSEIAKALEDDDFTALDEEGRNIAERLKALEFEAFKEWLTLFPDKSDVFPQREERLYIRNEQGQAIGSAKPDVFWVHGKYALSIDDKSGYLKVSASHRNYQLRLQAISLWCEYPVEHIRVGTAQYRFSGKLDVCDYDLKALQMAKKEYEFVWWRAQQPHAARQAGSWCRYCKAKSVCREAAAYSLLPVPVAKPGMDITAAVAQLSPEELAYIHQKKAIAEKVFEAVDTRLRSLPVEELNKVGLDLGKPGSQRVIEDIQKAWATLYNSGLINEEEFRTACKVAIGKLEEVLIPKVRARDKETSDAAAKRTVGKMLDSVVTHKPKAAPLVAYKPKEIGQ